MADFDQKNKSQSKGFLHWLGRLVYVAVVLAVTSFFTPGFSIKGIWSIILAAIIIIALDYLIELFTGFDASPLRRGLTGFIVSAVIIYVAQFAVPYMRVSILGALLAALVIGIIDAIIPGRSI